MDRTAFRINTFEEADSNAKYWRNKSPAERLVGANYLIRQAWNIAPGVEIKVNRTVSTVKSRKMTNVFNPDFQDFIKALNSAKVDYLLVGGYAVILHRYSRTTGDIDIWVNPTSENYQKIQKAFAEFGMSVFDMTESKFLQTLDYDVFSFGVPPSAIYLMTAVKGLDFNEAFTNSSVYEFENLSVRLIQYHDLIKAKKAAGRYRDLSDVEQLRKGREEE